MTRPTTLAPVAIIVLALAVLGVATAGMMAGREPFATWYYQLAWYPTLLAADVSVRLRTGRFFLLRRPAVAAALLAWSVPFWLLFELVNFRMANWYYVFVPADPVARWTGITLAFATVLPAILLAERGLAAAGLSGPETRKLRIPSCLPAALQAIGVGMVVVALAWPRLFYPLIWGAATLLLDPVVYRRAPARSLLGDLARGRPGRILRLLLGGLVIGLIWELFNSGARGKWIYTVPGLEELKLFEMPVAGFLGFPVLALDGWAFWQNLTVVGLAPARDPTTSSRRRRVAPAARATAALVALLFSAAVLRGMERFSIASYTPAVEDLAGVATEPLRRAGYDVFELAGSDPAAVARAARLPTADAARAVSRARLVTLRGIGTENAAALLEAGVGSVEELARAAPDTLVERLRQLSSEPVRAARVRVWVRGARAEAAARRAP